jgi:hypothetical protein
LENPLAFPKFVVFGFTVLITHIKKKYILYSNPILIILNLKDINYIVAVKYAGSYPG